MAHKIYENFVLENKMDDLLTTAIDMNEFITDCFKRKLDGSILTFKDIELNPKWSFVRLDSSNLVMKLGLGFMIFMKQEENHSLNVWLRFRLNLTFI